jgi:predicted nucleic acid-binding Zn ribbon protein
LGASLAPPTALARVQGRWAEVAGEAVAAESEPVSERDGVVTIRCSSAVWANELQLLSEDLLGRLNSALAGASEKGPVRGLRFVSGGRRGAL